jgi:hypothetical protein
MAAMSIHIVRRAGKWAVQTGPDQLSSEHQTQAEAIRVGRQMAREAHAEFVIHGRNGRVRAKDSYGNDPNPPRG